MGATHAEKSTIKAGQLNAVSSGSSGGGVAMAPAAEPVENLMAEPATDMKFCAIDNPDCEACQ